MTVVPTPEPNAGDVARYARAAARLAGLTVDDAWWPSVIRHLTVLLERAGSLEAEGIELPDDPGPVFQP